jgi:hypothetical protein
MAEKCSNQTIDSSFSYNKPKYEPPAAASVTRFSIFGDESARTASKRKRMHLASSVRIPKQRPLNKMHRVVTHTGSRGWRPAVPGAQQQAGRDSSPSSSMSADELKVC